MLIEWENDSVTVFESPSMKKASLPAGLFYYTKTL
jgi:hypothetical protein